MRNYDILQIVIIFKGNGTSGTDCACGCHERLVRGSNVASEMRKVLREELQITCCAGVATNKLLAKLVSGANKPNQQTVLFQEQVIRFMLTLNNLRQIPGTHKHSMFMVSDGTFLFPFKG